MSSLEIGIGGVPYEGIADYAHRRAQILTEAEMKQILVCAALDLAFERFKKHLNDKRDRLGQYEVNILVNKIGRIGVSSISKLPVFVTRKLGVGEYLRLLKASTCLRNFRKPLTLFFLLESYPAAIAHLSAKYAAKTIMYREAYLRMDESPWVRINYRLRRKNYEAALARDPLQEALSNCLEKYRKEHAEEMWFFTYDILSFLDMDLPEAILADGELVENVAATYRAGSCPSYSLTIIDLNDRYIVHASDIS